MTWLHNPGLTNSPKAQTGALDPTADGSASNFLDREKAILGDDAQQFESVGDDLMGGDDNLLSGGSTLAPGGNSVFESQFPDISNNANEVCIESLHPCYALVIQLT